MTLREELLAENHGDAREAASIFANRLTRDGPPGSFKVGYSRENAIIAAVELFPEVTPDAIRYWNGWGEPCSECGVMFAHKLSCSALDKSLDMGLGPRDSE